jgi:ATP-binding cassette subfamily B protein
MSYTTRAIQEFLQYTRSFNELPSEAIAELADKLQPLRYRMGQVIMVKEKMPPHIAILCEGEARLLGFDPHSQMPISLEKLEAGAAIGAVGSIRGVPCETAIASTEAICLILNTKDFLNLLDKYPELQKSFKDKSSLVEVFDLLGANAKEQVQSDRDLKELAADLLSEAKVAYLEPGIQTSDRLPLPSKHLWLVSGGGEIVDYPVGSRLRFDKDISTLEVRGKNATRLIGFPLGESSEEGETATQDGNGNGNSKLTHKPRTKTSLGDIEGIPEAPLVPPEPEPEPQEEYIETTTVQKRYPFVAGKGELDGTLACFQMISKYYGMPFRYDLVRRVLDEQIRRSGTVSLPLCGAVAELIGLNAQLVELPAKNFTRLEGPVMVMWQERIAVVYEIDERQLVIGVPERGIIRRRPDEFLDTWGEGGQVLILHTTNETPQEKFGLNWFIPAVGKYKIVLIEVLVASFFVQLFALANPLMMQVIIDKVLSQGSVETLKYLVALLIIISIFEALLTTLRTTLFVDTTNRIDMKLGSEIIDHLLRLPLRYFEKRPVGEISTRINELENIRQFLTGTALTVVLDAIFSVIYIVVMIIYSPLLTAVSLGVIPIFVVLTMIFSPTIRKQLRMKAERNAQTQSYLVEVMTGIQTVKAQNIELRSRWQWQERYARYIAAGFKTVLTSTIANSLSSFLNKLSSVLIIGVGAYLAIDGKMTLGQLIAFRIISGYVTSPIMRLAQLWQNFQETALSMERLADIVDTPEESEKDRGNIPMPTIKGRVKYEHVNFRFKQNSPLQLNDVKLEFVPGQFVALVGESGAGKSTLTKLLSRLYEPESGRILVDGYDINKVELYSLRSQVGVVPQDTLLFDGSIQDNIGLTNPDATTEQIIEAAQVAAAHEFIMKLPNGYNTRVGERGAALSGGQRQRIAIARTVLQNPRMLILDEATSALDYATEQEVCINLAEAFRDRTVFFITHRLGTIQNADVIVMMDSGRVIEIGNHEYLMGIKGRYYSLFKQQESQK